MPFIDQTSRSLVTSNPSQALLVPGNRTYLIYQEMQRRWKAEPRWATADKVHSDFVMDVEGNLFLDALYRKCPMMGWNELCNASWLAWQVFFQLVVMPYELEKRQTNGDVL